ncbi:HD-GYP domain-containing protein [Sulfurospirillum oryzae]|uniref:HD-GYP domain-containing protein n=1 Tax=Sulfurospirillum oryzae TaxID=2976535 RepID=UPI0021E7140B|nr:HD domain-containing phosphohydrolase [Sulfurospirillum oryzae]
MLYQINLREVTYALSEALDYVGIDDTMHGKRVAYIACEIAKKLGWRQSKLDKLILMAMLHDCGVSSDVAHHSIISHLDWEDSQIHCAKGASVLQGVPLYQEFADVIAFHHTHWEQFLPQIDEDIKLSANLIFISDRIDAMRSQFGAHLTHEKEYIRSTIQKYTPSMFAPKITQAFSEISATDTFWYYLEADPIHYYFSEWIEHGEIETVPFDFLKSIAGMFAKIVDAKESEAQPHTPIVASLARTMAELCNLPLREQEQIELAALLHDLGKLRIPDAIMGKNISLSDDEKVRIRRQGFDAHIILRQIKGFERIVQIIFAYHKTLKQEECPSLNGNETIPLEASILVIAHKLQTLLQNADENSFKGNLEVANLLQKMGNEYQLNPLILDKIKSHFETCYKKDVHL